MSENVQCHSKSLLTNTETHAVRSRDFQIWDQICRECYKRVKRYKVFREDIYQEFHIPFGIIENYNVKFQCLHLASSLNIGHRAIRYTTATTSHLDQYIYFYYKKAKSHKKIV